MSKHQHNDSHHSQRDYQQKERNLIRRTIFSEDHTRRLKTGAPPRSTNKCLTNAPEEMRKRKRQRYYLEKVIKHPQN